MPSECETGRLGESRSGQVITEEVVHQPCRLCKSEFSTGNVTQNRGGGLPTTCIPVEPGETVETAKVAVPAVTIGKVEDGFDPATMAHFVEMTVDENGERAPNHEKGILNYDELYDGTAMPSTGRRKKLKDPSPKMERLPPRPFSELECHNEREWGVSYHWRWSQR